MRTLAAHENGVYFKAAEFPHLKSNEWEGRPLYLDGLDEARGLRGDGDLLRSIAGTLRRQPAPRLRLSCRAADWNGAADTERLRLLPAPVTVATLQPLDDPQRLAAANFLGAAEPEALLSKVSVHGLDAMSRNPLMLRLLIRVDASGEWPTGRKALFERATELLANEHNPKRGQPTPQPIDRTLDDAGRCFAAMLLGGHVGVVSARDPFEAHRQGWLHVSDLLQDGRLEKHTLHFLTTNLMLPDGQDRLNPIHRAVAEFLAAQWLAKQVSNHRLSLRRLIGFICGGNPFPLPDLRGLFAWLPCFLPSHAAQLIERDPFGIAAYGDIASLSTEARRAVLQGLKAADNEDPWFRRGAFQSEPMAGLATPALQDELRDALRTRPVRHRQFLSCVMDALETGDHLPGLVPDLAAFLRDASLDQYQRLHAIDAFIAQTKQQPAERLALFRAVLEEVDDDARMHLCGRLLRHIYPALLSAAELGEFLLAYAADGSGADAQLDWWLPRLITADDVPVVLDTLTKLPSREVALGRDPDNEVRQVAAALTRRILPALHTNDSPRLLSWLEIVSDDHPSHREEEGLREDISRNRPLRLALYRAFITKELAADPTTNPLRLLFLFAERVGRSGWIASDVLPLLMQALAEPDEAVAACLYETALVVGLTFAPEGDSAWEDAWRAADARDEWRRRRDQHASVPWPSEEHRWRQRSRKRKAEQQQELDGWRRDMRARMSGIRDGTDVNALVAMANVYCGNFYNVPHDGPAAQRIEATFGQDVAEAAHVGMQRALLNDELPTPAATGGCCARRTMWTKASMWLVGATELWRTSPSRLRELPLDKRRALLALALGYNISLDRDRHTGWPWLDAVAETLTLSGQDVLLDLLPPQLEAGIGVPSGLHELCRDPRWNEDRNAACLELARRFPESPNIADLLDASLHSETLAQFTAIAACLLQDPHCLYGEPRWVWLSRAWLAAPEQYDALLHDHVTKDARHAATLGGWVRRFGSTQPPLPLLTQHLATIASILVGMWPPAPLPSEAYWSDHPYARAEAVRAAVAQLGNCGDATAKAALSQLLDDEAASRWHDEIRHALAGCRREFARRQGQPVAPEVILSISGNGTARPANAADWQEIVLDHLDAIDPTLRTTGGNEWRSFWHGSEAASAQPRGENECTSTVATWLRHRLEAAQLSIDVEVAQMGGSRCDLRLADRGWRVPIEAKRHWNAELWDGWRDQLRDRYTQDPQASGRGIYLVYWFGIECGRRVPRPPSGRPIESKEGLAAELEAVIRQSGHQGIEVKVLDVSWVSPRSQKTTSGQRATRKRGRA